MIWIAGVHFVGFVAVAVLMLPALRDDPGQGPGSDGDDGGGRGPGRPPQRPGPPRGGIPLPDADPAAIRFRGAPGRIGDLRRARERRPAREPAQPARRRPTRVGGPGPRRLSRR
jgi:hypothetical protein